MEKQTAGRKALGDFAPQFAALNDDVLFGEVWAKEMELSPKLRSIATVSALVDKGIAGDALRYHLQTAKKHGITKEEMAALLTHLAFYAGWPNAWAHSLWRRKSTRRQRMRRAVAVFLDSASLMMPMPSISRGSRI
ncbi:MAG: carboxymuconolactone decarboxylase family protein [Selenomonas sp.]|nr:carboxymuconolactone decarboxylase family protein [Selenomonas sp.]